MICNTYYRLKDPTLFFKREALRQNATILVQEHFHTRCINHGIIYVEPSDINVVWFLKYIEWLHGYGFSHDQDGFDAFLPHNGSAPYTYL